MGRGVRHPSSPPDEVFDALDYFRDARGYFGAYQFKNAVTALKAAVDKAEDPCAG
jgi:hypothetical protein